jgi:hypothetical protein
MLRTALRRTSFVAVLTLGAAAAIAACGNDAVGELEDDGLDASLPEGSAVAPDGAILGPDGAILVPPDSGEGGSGGSEGGDASAEGGDAALDAPIDADADAPVVDNGPLSVTYVDRDINQILSTGQSNAVASGARPSTTLPHNTVAITNAQPYTNVMFDTGVMTSFSCNGSGCPKANYAVPNAFVPLVEGDSFFGGAYVVETASSAMANLVSRIALDTFEFGAPARPTYPTKHDVLVSLHGRSGNKYVCLRKTAQTDPSKQPPPNDCALTYLAAFDEGMKQTQAAYDLAVAQGKTHAVRAVTVIHGESDHNGSLGDFPMRGSDGVAGKIKNYADALIEWQQDYEAGVKAITGQAEGVPLFVMGISGWTGPATYVGEPESPRYSPLAAQQHDAHVRAPGKVILVGPGYFIDQGTKGGNNTSPECLHQSIVGQRQIGEYFAKVYAKVVFKGEAWEPVRPKSVARAGNVVTVEYHVPVPPLTLDTTLVTKPDRYDGSAAENYGFEYRVGGHSGARQEITSVVVSGPTTVTITLKNAPGGADHHLLYAQNQRAFGQGCTGPGVQSDGALYAGGARGNLRDSDVTPSNYGATPLYNWGVIFDIAVP